LGRQGKQRPEGEKAEIRKEGDASRLEVRGWRQEEGRGKKAEIRKEELGVSPPQRSADKRSGDGRREGRGKKSEVGG
jgi:hypothetical protein